MLSDHILKEETCLWVTDMSPGSLRVTGHLSKGHRSQSTALSPTGRSGPLCLPLRRGRGRHFLWEMKQTPSLAVGPGEGCTSGLSLPEQVCDQEGG